MFIYVLFKKYESSDIYSGKEKIPFKERISDYKMILNLNLDTMVVGLDLNFIERVLNFSDNRLKGIINSSVEKLTNMDLLVMCSKINKDQEILKYIVFSLMKSSISISTISQVSGKSVDFIRECERLIYDEKIAIYD